MSHLATGTKDTVRAPSTHGFSPAALPNILDLFPSAYRTDQGTTWRASALYRREVDESGVECDLRVLERASSASALRAEELGSRKR